MAKISKNLYITKKQLEEINSCLMENKSSDLGLLKASCIFFRTLRDKNGRHILTLGETIDVISNYQIKFNQKRQNHV